MKQLALPATSITIAALVVLTGLLPAPAAAAQNAPRMQFRTERIVDTQQGGLVAATISVPTQWRVNSQILWNYKDVSHPVRTFVRVESPDGSAWVEFFPIEVFYWLDPNISPVANGARTLGMIHGRGINVVDALKHFVVAPYRSRNTNLQIVSNSPLDPARLAQAFGNPPAQGEAAMMRLRYTRNGQNVDEDLFALLGTGNRIPYTGPQGTTYESHRPLVYVHALGATNGQLQSMYPLLGYIATSIKVEPGWEAHKQRVQDQLNALFNQAQQAGYAQIAAAGEASRRISANNDAMLASMQSARQAQAQRDAQVRAAAKASQGPNDGFSQYLRGTERMKDPYWGESDQSYHQRYHWTDGSGNYRSSNDSTFNPNVGGGGGVTWQRMEPAR